ncbi:Zn-ribbon domain-containing OB-fold protein [Xanthobacteraceae bacterium A53D]
MSGERKIETAMPSPETRAFWDAASKGTFLIRRCTSCARSHWYPRIHCPFCDGGTTEWVEASGRGIIYSYSLMARVPQPYVVAYVTLAEGPTIVSNIVGCDPAELQIGQPVEVTFLTTETDQGVPVFRPRPLPPAPAS